jgi:hypothetical protein
MSSFVSCDLKCSTADGLYVAYEVSSLVEHGLLTRLEHMSSSSVFGGFRVTRPLVFHVVFCRGLFFLFSFGHCVVLCSQIFAPKVQKLVLKGTGIHWRPIVLFCRFMLNMRKVKTVP